MYFIQKLQTSAVKRSIVHFFKFYVNFGTPLYQTRVLYKSISKKDLNKRKIYNCLPGHKKFDFLSYLQQFRFRLMDIA